MYIAFEWLASRIYITGIMKFLYETPSVSATKDNEEIELEGKGDIRQDRVMTKAVAVSHPMVEYSGSVRLSGRHNAT